MNKDEQVSDAGVAVAKVPEEMAQYDGGTNSRGRHWSDNW